MQSLCSPNSISWKSVKDSTKVMLMNWSSIGHVCVWLRCFQFTEYHIHFEFSKDVVADVECVQSTCRNFDLIEYTMTKQQKRIQFNADAMDGVAHYLMNLIRQGLHSRIPLSLIESKCKTILWISTNPCLPLAPHEPCGLHKCFESHKFHLPSNAFASHTPELLTIPPNTNQWSLASTLSISRSSLSCV